MQTPTPNPDPVLTDQEQIVLHSMAYTKQLMLEGKHQDVIDELIEGSKKDPAWFIDFIMTLAMAEAKVSAALSAKPQSSLILPGHLQN